MSLRVMTVKDPKPVRLGLPLTDIFRRNQAALLPLVSAVSFKGPSDEAFPGKVQFLESSFNIGDPAFADDLARAGHVDALKSGCFSSFACDLGPACEVDIVQSPNGYPRYVPRSRPAERDVYLACARRNVEWLRTFFDGAIKLENLNYFPSGAYEMVCAPDFIARLVRELEIELLLDIGHAAISAANLSAPAEHYLDGLPLERVSEVQLSGPRVIGGVWEDAHETPAAGDYALLEYLLHRTGAEYVTLEYYRDDRALVDECRQLAGRLAQPNGAHNGIVA